MKNIQAMNNKKHTGMKGVEMGCNIRGLLFTATRIRSAPTGGCELSPFTLRRAPRPRPIGSYKKPINKYHFNFVFSI